MIRGNGWSEVEGDRLPWKKGDIFTLPARAEVDAPRRSDSAFYWVHDEPLLRYLGVEATTARFRPTLYPQERADAELKIVEQDPEAAKRSRVSVLLANKEFPQTRTVTHVIWSMFGVLPAGSVQLPHHHESVALDLIIDCEPGCYTLIGRDLDKDGHIINPKRRLEVGLGVRDAARGSGTRTTMRPGRRRTCSRSRMRGCTPTCAPSTSTSTTRTTRPTSRRRSDDRGPERRSGTSRGAAAHLGE